MLENEEYIKFWIDSAENDLNVAESLFSNAKYDWCLFIGHLVLEKCLKAYYIKTKNELSPPKIHNLNKLVKLSGLTISDDLVSFFELVNNFHLESRYPEFKFEFYKIATKEYTEENFIKIKETYLWLKSLIK